MPSNSLLAVVAVGVAVVSALTVLNGRRRTPRGCSLPPGPVPLPVVGNLLSVDSKIPWLTYAEWATRYGDIFMIRMFKQKIVVISSKKAAKELLERRSNIYSDRPYLSTRIPYGWEFNFGFTPYGNTWRSQRRIFHQAFRAEAALAYHPTQLRKARQLVLDFHDAPRDYSMHLQRFAHSTIMSIVYDYEVTSHHDHYVELFERGGTLALGNLTPEAACILEAFPFLLSLPKWFPGGSLRRRAAVSKDCATRMVAEPFEYAKKREAADNSKSAIALDLLKSMKDIDDPSQLKLIKDTCAAAFVAGAGTTSSTLQWVMLSMLQHPEVQERAQAEIDAVVGTNRLPDFDDRPNLPYVEAILMEILRMYPVAPLGVAHATTADDVYEDLFIPKGTTVVSNIWAIQRDEDVYSEPHVFKPERFLDGELREDVSVDSLAFGFGRRICPGRYTADSSIWIAMASILSAFKITKARNERGEEIDFEPTFSHGVIWAPRAFPCAITPRLSGMDIRQLSMVGV